MLEIGGEILFLHLPRHKFMNDALAVSSDNPPDYEHLQGLLLKAASWENAKVGPRQHLWRACRGASAIV